MEKLYFKNEQELANFLIELTKDLKAITINNTTFYLINCKIRLCGYKSLYIDIVDLNKNLICCMRVDMIEKINEYKIIKEWN